jgi:hypothetical protein
MATASLTESDHFEKCCVCARWFDLRDLAQVADHIHDDSQIEILEGSARHARSRCTEIAPAGASGKF